MLLIKSTLNNTGISVTGSYDDLKELYDAFMSVIGDEGDYSYNASARRRVYEVCREIRRTLQRENEIFRSSHGIAYYSFRVLWPEAAFVTAVLDNFVMLSIDRKLYVSRMTEREKSRIQTVSDDHIALIHYFQDLVWNELERVVGSDRIRAIFGEYYDLRGMHFKFPQFDGYYTQWLDLLNIKYLWAEPEWRGCYLAAILKRLFIIDEPYISLKNSIEMYAEKEGVRITGVSFPGCIYPENLVW